MRKAPEQRKLELIKIGSDLFAKHGYEKVRVEDILETAGMSKGGFYHYFKSKDDVLREIVQMEMKELTEQLDKNLKSKGPVESLINLFSTASADITATAGVLDTLSSFHAKSVYLNELENLFEKMFLPSIEKLIAHGIKTGSFRQVNPKGTAEVFIAVNNHGNRQSVLEQRTEKDLQAFNSTALEILGVHLGIQHQLEKIRNHFSDKEKKE